MMSAALLFGWGSLLLFGVFLFAGPVSIVRLNVPEHQALLWDVFLSLLFFVQHSVMIRTSFQTRLARIIPRHYHPSTYAIASGVALAAMVLLWQPSRILLYQTDGALYLLARAVSVLAVAGFAWGVRALEGFDTFGLGPIKAHLRGRPLRTPSFIVRGPYRWVRHPLYFFMLVLFWSFPDGALDRLLFNALWTGWVIVGTRLEEKDLVEAFGEEYRRYQETVPMLFPWRIPPRLRDGNRVCVRDRTGGTAGQ
jgi:protein-S-isoprenylcysteine O-methyltransferase Ste14